MAYWYLAVAAVGIASSIAKGSNKQKTVTTEADAEYENDLDRAAAIERNAALLEQEAKSVITSGRRNASLREIQTEQDVGKVRASSAGGGVVVDSGTSRAVAAAEKFAGDTDSNAIRTNAFREAFNLEDRAEQKRLDAELVRKRAKEKKDRTIAAGKRNALGDYLGGASSLFNAFGSGGS